MSITIVMTVIVSPTWVRDIGLRPYWMVVCSEARLDRLAVAFALCAMRVERLAVCDSLGVIVAGCAILVVSEAGCPTAVSGEESLRPSSVASDTVKAMEEAP